MRWQVPNKAGTNEKLLHGFLEQGLRPRLWHSQNFGHTTRLFLPKLGRKRSMFNCFECFLIQFSVILCISPCIRDFLKHKDGGKAIQLVAGNFTNKIPNFE